MADDKKIAGASHVVCAKCGAEVASDLRDCKACGFPVASLRSFKFWISFSSALLIVLIGLIILIDGTGRMGADGHSNNTHFESSHNFSVNHSSPYNWKDVRIPGGRRFWFNYSGEGLQFWGEVQEDGRTTHITPRVESPDHNGKIKFWWQRDAAGGEIKLEIGDPDEDWQFLNAEINQHSGRIGLDSDALWWGWPSSRAELSIIPNWSMATEEPEAMEQHGGNGHGEGQGDEYVKDGYGEDAHEHGRDDHGHGPEEDGRVENVRRGEEFILLRYKVWEYAPGHDVHTVEILLKAFARKLENKKSGSGH